METLEDSKKPSLAKPIRLIYSFKHLLFRLWRTIKSSSVKNVILQVGSQLKGGVFGFLLFLRIPAIKFLFCKLTTKLNFILASNKAGLSSNCINFSTKEGISEAKATDSIVTLLAKKRSDCCRKNSLESKLGKLPIESDFIFESKCLILPLIGHL